MVESLSAFNFKIRRHVWLFHCGDLYHIKNSPLICRANQWTCFYMIRTSVIKELISRWKTLTWNFTKSNTFPWVFLTFFKLYKWYQIVQSASYLRLSESKMARQFDLNWPIYMFPLTYKAQFEEIQKFDV